MVDSTSLITKRSAASARSIACWSSGLVGLGVRTRAIRSGRLRRRRFEGTFEALHERFDGRPVGGPGLEVQGEGLAAGDDAQVQVVELDVAPGVGELPFGRVVVAELH